MIHVCPTEIMAVMQLWQAMPVVYHHGKELACKCICHIRADQTNIQVECDEPDCNHED